MDSPTNQSKELVGTETDDDEMDSPTNLNSDASSNEGIRSWLSSFFHRKDDKVQSSTNQNLDVSSNEEFSSRLSSFFQKKDDKTDSPTNQSKELVGTKTDEVEREVREQSIVKLQSLIRGYVARKHYKSLTRDENPPLRAIRYFSQLLNPIDTFSRLS